jgi:fumarate reductase subunit C
MNAQTDKRRPYIRSMSSWWKRDPYFVRYMAMEATSVLVAVYALVLMLGVFRLSQGEAEYGAWLEALKSPWSVLAHVVILAVFVYHTWSWFKIMPKTMPAIVVGGSTLPQPAITWIGVGAAIVTNLLVLVILAWVKP